IVLVVRAPVSGLADLELGPAPLIVVTEDVQKPGNLGAILRSADGAGADGVIAIGGTDLFNPNVVRASVGTVFAVPLATATATDARAWLRDQEIRIVAARVDGARLHSEADLTGPLAIVLGSEAEGLTAAWRGVDVEPVRLPMLGVADSLNVSAAAAILLYEARRQRDAAAAENPARGHTGG
ncbi:MAG TPA: TrmH family RNA methyltransferase, partial [Candidatus Limnocylindrales bacterium]